LGREREGSWPITTPSPLGFAYLSRIVLIFTSLAGVYSRVSVISLLNNQCHAGSFFFCFNNHLFHSKLFGEIVTSGVFIGHFGGRIQYAAFLPEHLELKISIIETCQRNHLSMRKLGEEIQEELEFEPENFM